MAQEWPADGAGRGSNGKSYEPEPVKGSGLSIWDWRPTLLFGLVARTAA
jgi:hypothetical protein